MLVCEQECLVWQGPCIQFRAQVTLVPSVYMHTWQSILKGGYKDRVQQGTL